jgi:site-specific recombinase XerD
VQIGEAVGEYLAAKKQLKSKTCSEYGRMLALFSGWCKGKEITLEVLKARQVGEYVGYLSTMLQSKQGGKVSTHTVAYHVRVLKAFLRWCALDEDFEQYVKLPFVQKIENPRKELKIVETFSVEQVRELFAACEREISPHLQQRNRAIVLLLLDTGIRAAELVGLHLDQVDVSPKDPHVRVFGKGDKWREIGLGARSRKELWRYILHFREKERGKHEPLFLSHSCKALTIEGLADSIERLGKWAGIKGVRCSPHTFRHTFAVAFMRKNNDIYRLSKLMGHTSVSITENYLKSFSQVDLRKDIFSPLDEMF